MEFIEGTSLLSKERPRPLPEAKAPEYAAQIRDALANGASPFIEGSK